MELILFKSVLLFPVPAIASGDLETLKEKARVFLDSRNFNPAHPDDLFKAAAIDLNFGNNRDSVNYFFLSEILLQENIGDTWTNSLLNNFYYNDSNRIQEIYYRQWDSISETWLDFNRDIYTYGPEGYPALMNFQLWNPDIEEWEDLIRVNFTYQFLADSALVDQLLMEINYGGFWMNLYHYDYTYNIYNQVILVEEDGFDLLSQDWENLAQNTFSYNNNNLLEEELMELWQDSVWINQSLSAYTYNGQNQNTVLLQQYWNADSGWVDNDRWTYSYQNNNLELELLENHASGAWENVTLTNSDFNPDNLLISELEQSWIPSRAWQESYLSTYTYDNIIGINEAPGNAFMVSVFPNPVSNSASFILKTEDSTPFEISVRDAKGAEVYHATLSMKGMEPAVFGWQVPAGLTDGIYFYSIESAYSVVSGKIVLSR
jgi:hypothetical protein